MKEMPDFESERLQFYALKASDLHCIHELHSFPEVAQYNTIGIPKNLAATRRVLSARLDSSDRTELGWVLRDKDNQFVGEMGLKEAAPRFQKAEISYSIHPDFWNQGFASEALKRLLQQAFDVLHLHRVEAGVAVANAASIRVLEKAGMQREGRHRDILPLASGWSDNFSYALLASDFQNKKG